MPVDVVLLVPFRPHVDQRQQEQLDAFMRVMPGRLDKGLGKGTYAILIGQQSDDGELFARSRILNALAAMARVKYPGARFVFHNTDTLPSIERIAAFRTKFLPGKGLLSFAKEVHPTPPCLGGICAIEPDLFFDPRVNGLPNEMIGWCNDTLCLLSGCMKVLGDDCIQHVTAGTATDVTPVGAVRARLTSSCKLTHETRSAIMKSIFDHGNNNGVDNLAFGVTSIDAYVDLLHIRRYQLEVFVTLPEGYSCRISTSHAKPFYWSAAGDGSFRIPPASIIKRRALEPVPSSSDPRPPSKKKRKVASQPSGGLTRFMTSS